MSIFSWLFGTTDSVEAAHAIMRRLNKNAIIGREGVFACMVEDHADPDGRWFRLEYLSTGDGKRAIAICRYNPWGSVKEMHTVGNGVICVGPGGHVTNPHESRYSLRHVISRARLWCTLVSVYHESGSWPNE
jgi:hypothetical protein